MSERISVLVKFPPELLARVAAVAGQSRMAVILDLIERGLGAPAAAPVMVSTPKGLAKLERPDPRPPGVGPSWRDVVASPDQRYPLRNVVGFHPVTGEPVYRESKPAPVKPAAR